MVRRLAILLGLILLTGPSAARGQELPAVELAPEEADLAPVEVAKDVVPVAEPRRAPLSLAEVLQQAVVKHPQLEASAQETITKKSAAHSVETNYWGKLTLSANVLLWDSEQVLSLGGGGGGAGGQLPPPATPYEAALAGFLTAMSTPITIRDQITTELKLTAMQPITPLYKVSLGSKASELEVTVAEMHEETLRDKITGDSATAYFRALQAQSMLETTRESVRRLEAQKERMEVLLSGKVVSELDVKRLELGLAAARQKVLSAETSVEMAESYLAVTMGRPPAETVVPESVEETPLEPVTQSLEELYELALTRRAELVELEKRLEQSRLGEDLAEADYVPNLVAIGAYTHSTGSGLSGADTLFVGLFLDWTVWEWGRIGDDIDAAEARTAQVEYTRENVENMLRLQVKQAYLEQKSSADVYELTKLSVGLAEDSYEMEVDRMESGVTTGADLVGAESALTEARNNRTASYYNTIIARVALAEAVNAELSADTILRGVFK